jgi:hypothetical protein
MRIPPDAIISPEKVRDYLLVEQPRDDKSKFLTSAGFKRSNWRELEAAIRDLAASVDAKPGSPTPHGKKWVIDGIITGPIGRPRTVRLIWLEEPNGIVRFVTLVPKIRG